MLLEPEAEGSARTDRAAALGDAHAVLGAPASIGDAMSMTLPEMTLPEMTPMATATATATCCLDALSFESVQLRSRRCSIDTTTLPNLRRLPP
jgi:hypothetical protein